MLTNKQVSELINSANFELKNNGKSKRFEELCKLILDDASINQIIEFVKNVKVVDVLPFSKIVLQKGDAKHNLEMAFIVGSDSRAHRDFIINSQDIECNLIAGKSINDGYREEYMNKHGKVVLKGTAHQNYKYLERNRSKTLDRQRHIDIIIESKNEALIVQCAKNIEGVDVLELGKLIIDSKKVINNIAFARIKGADIKAHLDVVLQFGDACDNFDVIKEFKDRCNIQEHISSIFKSKDNETKYNCLMWLKKSNLINRFKSYKPIQEFINLLHKGKVKLDYDFIDEYQGDCRY